MYLGMAVWIEVGVKCRFGCHLLQVLRTREQVTSPKEGRQCDKRAPRKGGGAPTFQKVGGARGEGVHGGGEAGGGRGPAEGSAVEVRVMEERWSVTRVQPRACRRHANLSCSVSNSDTIILTSRRETAGGTPKRSEREEKTWIKLSIQPRLQEGKLVCLSVRWFVYFLLTEEKGFPCGPVVKSLSANQETGV